MMHLRCAARGACALALAILLTACGGSSSAPTSEQPAQIQGIATPSSVAVVTATNAE